MISNIAILSNINVMPLVKKINNSNYKVYQNIGYGNELELMLDFNSSLWKFSPDVIFIIIDILELVHHDFDIISMKKNIDNWFNLLSSSMQDNVVYVISDVIFRGIEIKIYENTAAEFEIVSYWKKGLDELKSKNSMIIPFEYSRLVNSLGEKAYSDRMWYLGKIIHSSVCTDVLKEEITNILTRLQSISKKLLLLDLDNTLWGGIVGDVGIEGIKLSEEKTGLIYKDLQRILLAMKKKGVMLGIVSKNNEDIAVDVINNHPQMVLQLKDFVAIRVNWENKSENIKSIVKELNIGLDSVVFFDDNVLERKEIKFLLPEVTVPEFPDRIEDLPICMEKIYDIYFKKNVITQEDANKTQQYLDEKQREQLRLNEYALDYEGYLKSLKISVIQKSVEKNIDRAVQLLNKTNQFNLTTNRYTLSEFKENLYNAERKYYVFSVKDKVGDAGIISVVGVKITSEAIITDFVMSCRVMSRNIENCILDIVEKDLISKGYNEIYAYYKQTSKNSPVADFYDKLGYVKIRRNEDGMVVYKIDNQILQKYPRKYYIDSIVEIEEE